MDTDKYQLLINEFRLNLIGNSCEECRSICQAICCKFHWPIPLSKQEYHSGQYAAIIICSLSGNDCNRDKDECQYRTYQLRKKDDGSCVYLNESNYCSIHPSRPNVCRNFNCSYSFNLTPTQNERKPHIKTKAEKIKTLIDDEILILHPLTRLKGVILQKKLKQIYFLLEIISGCGIFYSYDEIDMPNFEEDHIATLVNLFEQRLPLGSVRTNFLEKYVDVHSNDNFHKLVDILLKHNILINVRNLRGLLSGLGL